MKDGIWAKEEIQIYEVLGVGQAWRRRRGYGGVVATTGKPHHCLIKNWRNPHNCPTNILPISSTTSEEAQLENIAPIWHLWLKWHRGSHPLWKYLLVLFVFEFCLFSMKLGPCRGKCWRSNHCKGWVRKPQRSVCRSHLVNFNQFLSGGREISSMVWESWNGATLIYMRWSRKLSEWEFW